MPHQCTSCKQVFPNGARDILSGCPECGGRKFQYRPTATTPVAGDPAEDPGDIIEAPSEPEEPVEDRAQADARAAVVSDADLPPTTPQPAPTGVDGTERESASEPEPAPEEPDLATVEAELAEQFESIRILRPGEYEINLMELYDREEHIIALEEDGRYAITVPGSWRDTNPDNA